VFVPLIAVIFWMGIYSKPFVSRMEPAVTQFVEQMSSYRSAMEARDGAVTEEARLATDDGTGEN
jgi:hypothetical protein